MPARVHVTGRDVFIVGAARTPIGRYGGTLKSMHPAELGAVAAKAALERATIAPDDVDEVFIGHGRQAGSGPNTGRQVASRAGIPVTAPAQTINQACASSLQAVALGAQAIELGQSDVVLSGGIESMSRMPYLVDSDDARWGHRMGNFTLVDAMYRDGFTCSISGLILGQTAEILARDYGITRDQSDEYALGSQLKAEAAIKAGRFAGEIAPVAIEGRKGEKVFFAADEHPRAGATVEGLRKLPPVFPDVDGQPGIITAGSSSGITDGGAAVVLASGDAVTSRGLTPMARIIGWATAGVDPRIMGIGPVPAVQALLEKTGLSMDDFDLVELNEAFAPQVLAVLRDVPIAPDRLNVNGGAIALGHPIGATGARILVTLVHEMKRRGAKRGLATLCVSGGLGMALAVEAV
ncbi:MAG TPA: acetyl-CoA C-acetyltransferase [Vicinamibacterales bacterium]|nr:acetyl-CoA C-acetyltransferase [Vicinamibacterales bacterium]